MLLPEITEKPEKRFVGLEVSFLHGLSPVSTAAKVVPPLWEKFGPIGGQVPGRVGHAMYGIIYGPPESDRSHPDELQYIAAVAVSKDAEVPPGMVSRTVPAGTFAVFVHRGPIHKIKETCFEIYRVWLPAADYRHAGIADVELYDDRFCFDGAESEMEYWISIVPKQ